MDFETIQGLKKDKIRYKNINFGRVITAKLYSKSIKDKLSCIILYLLYNQKINYLNNGSKILISYPFELGKRKDYEYIINELKKICENYSEIYLYKKLNLKNVFFKIFFLLKEYLKNKELKLKFLEKLQVLSLYIYFRNFLDDELSLYDFKEETYISFCDSYLQENLLAQYLKNKHKTTITLQHGQYRIVKKGYETTDCESYLNFVSDYIFVWGEKTKEELLKVRIEQKKILVAGALKEFSKKYVENELNKSKKICVILNGETHSESNFRLLEYADLFCKKTGYKYYLRPHPMNKLNKYLNKINKENLLEIIDSKKYEKVEKEIEFDILHMTGVFVELLAKSKIFFILNDEWTEEIFKLKDFIFKDEIELYNKYSKLNENRDLYLESIKAQYLKYNCVKNEEELKENYRSKLKKIGVI